MTTEIAKPDLATATTIPDSVMLKVMMSRKGRGLALKVESWAVRVKKYGRAHRRLRLASYVALAILTLNIVIGVYGYNLKRGQPYEFGTSFSLKMARELGIEPKAALEGLLKDVGLKHLRLMSYWNEHEPQQARSVRLQRAGLAI
jgi:hypothetical protein